MYERTIDSVVAEINPDAPGDEPDQELDDPDDDSNEDDDETDEDLGADEVAAAR